MEYLSNFVNQIKDSVKNTEFFKRAKLQSQLSQQKLNDDQIVLKSISKIFTLDIPDSKKLIEQLDITLYQIKNNEIKKEPLEIAELLAFNICQQNFHEEALEILDLAGEQNPMVQSKKAQLLFSKGLYGRAKTFYEILLSNTIEGEEKNPTDIEYFLQCLYKLGQCSEAVKFLQTQLLQKDSSCLSDEKYLDIAKICTNEAGDPWLALRLIAKNIDSQQKADKIKVRNIQIENLIAAVQLNIWGSFQEQIQQIEQLASTCGDYWRFIYLQSLVYLQEYKNQPKESTQSQSEQKETKNQLLNKSIELLAQLENQKIFDGTNVTRCEGVIQLRKQIYSDANFAWERKKAAVFVFEHFNDFKYNNCEIQDKKDEIPLNRFQKKAKKQLLSNINEDFDFSNFNFEDMNIFEGLEGALSGLTGMEGLEGLGDLGLGNLGNLGNLANLGNLGNQDENQNLEHLDFEKMMSSGQQQTAFLDKFQQLLKGMGNIEGMQNEDQQDLVGQQQGGHQHGSQCSHSHHHNH